MNGRISTISIGCNFNLGQGDTPLKTNKTTDKSIDAWQTKFTDSYCGDFFKGYAAFLGKDFLSSYGNYSTGFLEKNIQETSQF